MSAVARRLHVARWESLTVIFVACAGTGRIASWLMDTPDAMGRDGYYYLLQIEALRLEGHLHFATPFPLALWVMAAIAALLSDPILAVKLVASLCSFGLVLVTRTIVTQATGSAKTGLGGALLCAAAGPQYYFAGEFVANFVGMLGVAALVAALGWKADARWRRAAIAASATVACLSHGSAALATACLLGVDAVLQFCRGRWRVAVLAGAVTAAATVLMVGVVATDPGRIASHVTAVPNTSFAVHFSAPFGWGVLFAALAIGLRCAVGRGPRPASDPGGARMCTLAGVAVLWCANPWLVYSATPEEIPDRLALWGWWFAAVLGPTALAWSRAHQRRWSLIAWGAILATVLGCADTRLPVGTGQRFVRDRRSAVAYMRKRLPLPAGAVVVAERGVHFAVEYTTGVPAVSRRALVTTVPGTRIYWLIRVPPERGAAADPVAPSAWGLVADTQLTSFLAAAGPHQRAEILRLNRRLMGSRSHAEETADTPRDHDPG